MYGQERHEVVLTIGEWYEIEAKLDRLEQLEAEVADYHSRDREYLQWSLSPERLTDALNLAHVIEEAIR